MGFQEIPSSVVENAMLGAPPGGETNTSPVSGPVKAMSTALLREVLRAEPDNQVDRFADADVDDPGGIHRKGYSADPLPESTLAKREQPDQGPGTYGVTDP